MDKIAIIVNKKARNAKKIASYLQALSANQISYQLFEVEPVNLDTTIKHCMQQCSLLLIGGGDGSIRTAAQHCANTSTILGVLSLGTMNHFAKELNLPSSCEALIDALKKPEIIKIDLAQVNEWVFINNSSIGFYPKLAKQRVHFTRFYNKWLSYIPSFIQTLKHHEIFSLTIKSTDFNQSLKTSFLMISNNLYSYQFPATIRRDSFQQKLLGVYFLKHGRFRLAKIFYHLLSKKNYFESMSSKSAIKIEVEGRMKINISLDGDTVVVKTPLTYKSLPAALQLLTSKS